jgi:uncharacterized protein YjeT (DUF2065 family)
MGFVYQLIGRIVVAAVRQRFGRQLQLAGGIAVATGVLVAYLFASRGVEEG